MKPPLFDDRARLLVRDRAATLPDAFLFDRLFDEMLDRLDLLVRPARRVLLVGAPRPGWTAELERRGMAVTVIEPGRRLAQLVDGLPDVPLDLPPFDLAVALTLLETVEQLPVRLAAIRRSLAPHAPLLGTMLGGDSLPQLRRTMIAFDQRRGSIAPRIHPRVDPPTLAALLVAAGFAEPVIEVDRVELRYSGFDRLLGDLRAHGASNVLAARSRAYAGRAALATLRRLFLEGAEQDRVSERIDLLQFIGWTPALPARR